MIAYETNKVCEISFSNVSPAALEVICASVIAVGLLLAVFYQLRSISSSKPRKGRTR